MRPPLSTTYSLQKSTSANHQEKRSQPRDVSKALGKAQKTQPLGFLSVYTATNETPSARGGQRGSGLGSAAGMLRPHSTHFPTWEIQSAFCWEHVCPSRALRKCYCQRGRRADGESRAGRGSRTAETGGGVGVPARAPWGDTGCPESLGSDPHSPLLSVERLLLTRAGLQRGNREQILTWTLK